MCDCYPIMWKALVFAASSEILGIGLIASSSHHALMIHLVWVYWLRQLTNIFFVYADLSDWYPTLRIGQSPIGIEPPQIPTADSLGLNCVAVLQGYYANFSNRILIKQTEEWKRKRKRKWIHHGYVSVIWLVWRRYEKEHIYIYFFFREASRWRRKNSKKKPVGRKERKNDLANEE